MTWEVKAGRVLQVSLGGKEAFWTAPDATDWNVGGDRLWLGPERDWFWTGDSTDLSAHEVPPQIDPGEWRTASESSRHVSFVADPVLGATNVHIRRDLYLLQATGTRVVYDVHTSLTVTTGPPDQEVDLWSVLQVPTGGVLSIDLAGPWRYRDYLKPFDGFRIVDGRAEVTLTGEAMGKIGVSPDVFAGQVRYVREGLVVERHVTVQPTRRYCDHPLGADRATQGDCLQIFEDDGHYGGYAEIEHHSPAVRLGDSVVDVCRTIVTAAEASAPASPQDSR